MLARAMKMAFWITYDHLGKFLVAGLLWSLSLLVPAWVAVTALLSGQPGVRAAIGLPAALFAVGVVLPVPSAGLAHLVKVLIDHRDGSLGDFFRGMRLYALKSVLIGLIAVFALASLSTSTWFYADKLRGSAPWLGYALSGIALWGLVFAAPMALLVLPTLVQKKAGIGATLKLSALLVLGHPLFSLGLALQALALTAVCLIIFPLFLFVYGPILAALTGSAYEMLARKYAPTDAGGPASQPPYPTDDEDDYLNRGFRDFLFPWKG
ncbi:MAG TPA: hypothetical protein PLD73_00740 [Candidatus Hydrogenedentes bacterium]|jgi:hypothetical protein|nr:hypothetical protein [Candidatus Hydrogenedentota bacterium]HPJ98064.1 hypothetical protein [Candidatus Hydrogenedentota bacterium]